MRYGDDLPETDSETVAPLSILVENYRQCTSPMFHADIALRCLRDGLQNEENT